MGVDPDEEAASHATAQKELTVLKKSITELLLIRELLRGHFYPSNTDLQGRLIVAHLRSWDCMYSSH